MKKFFVLLTSLVIIFGFASAFAAGDGSDSAQKPGKLYNGITYFDARDFAPKAEAGTAKKEAATKPFNGITYFDLGQPRPEKGYAAGGSGAGESSGQKPYNGITVF